MDAYIAAEPPSIRQQIEKAYLHELKTEGKPPISIFKLCQTLGLSERDFFSEYSSLEAVEMHWWKDMMDRVILSVESGAEWPDFSARNRLLAFFFAFTTASLDYRSLLLMRMGHTNPLKSVPEWSALEDRYEVFALSILMHGRQQDEIATRGPVNTIYPRVLKLLLRSVVAFNLKDTSPKFERTDAFIEKSITLLFDLMGRQALDSGFDLLRFLVPGALHRV